MLVSPITFAEIDQICPIYVKTYGWDMVAKQIKRNGCSRNDILQIFYGMDKPIKEMMLIASNRWCRFDRNTDIMAISLSCVLNSTKPRIRLDSAKRRNMPTQSWLSIHYCKVCMQCVFWTWKLAEITLTLRLGHWHCWKILIIRIFYLVLGLWLLGAQNFAHASCSCVCMDGKNQAVCSSSMDLRPLCPPKVCPLARPAIKPLDSPRLPPLGTTQCTNKQVYNPYSRKYEWKRVCS